MQHRSHRVEHTLNIERPIEQCYDALIHFEKYPAFIPNLTIEHKGEEGVWQWTFQDQEGREFAWDLKLDGLRHQNNVISWHTIRMPDIAHNGAITLSPLEDNKTRLHFVVEYEPSVQFYQEIQKDAGFEFNDNRFVKMAGQSILRTLENLKSTVLSEQSTV